MVSFPVFSEPTGRESISILFVFFLLFLKKKQKKKETSGNTMASASSVCSSSTSSSSNYVQTFLHGCTFVRPIVSDGKFFCRVHVPHVNTLETNAFTLRSSIIETPWLRVTAVSPIKDGFQLSVEPEETSNVDTFFDFMSNLDLSLRVASVQHLFRRKVNIRSATTRRKFDLFVNSSPNPKRREAAVSVFDGTDILCNWVKVPAPPFQGRFLLSVSGILYDAVQNTAVVRFVATQLQFFASDPSPSFSFSQKRTVTEPSSCTNNNLPPAKLHRIYGKFLKMLDMRVPPPAVRQKMFLENVIDHPILSLFSVPADDPMPAAWLDSHQTPDQETSANSLSSFSHLTQGIVLRKRGNDVDSDGSGSTKRSFINSLSSLISEQMIIDRLNSLRKTDSELR